MQRKSWLLFSWFFLTTSIIIFVAGVTVSAANMSLSSQQSSFPWLGSTASPEVKATQVLAQMTLDEKISLMGLAKSPDGYENFVPSIPRLRIPRLTLQDGPAGVATGFLGVTQLPAPIALASTWDLEAAALYGNIQGTESWGKGIMVAQGPMVNIARVPQGGRVFEGFGEDPYLVSQIAVANVKAIQATGVMANVKPFAGNNQETKRYYTNDIVSERALREIYFPAFEAAVKDGDVSTAMCAYNKVNGPYACASSYMLADVFKGEWGFQGFIRSDLGAVHDVALSFNAGTDQAKPEFNAELKAAVLNGQVPMSRIDDAVTRILRMMFRYNLIDNPPTGTPQTVVTSPQHAAIARRIAEQGTVLLKNEDKILPLSPEKVKSIAVIGIAADSAPQTNGAGSSAVRAPYIITPYIGIKNRAGKDVNVTYVPGDATYQGNAFKAVEVAKQADVAIVFAKSRSTEGVDQTDLSLPNDQDLLIRAVSNANPNTIVVLSTGNPVTMPWLGRVKAVIEGWYAGQEAGNAIAAVLFGDVNPSGKLPVTFPKNIADIPVRTPKQFPGVNGDVYYSEDLQVGYRWYDAQDIEPLFPFGFGLSYTTFALSNLEVGPKELDINGQVTVGVDVTNTGNRRGAEVVQLYLNMPVAVNEPPKQLKGFQKVLLQPGETQRVTLNLSPRDLSYWDSRVHDWVMPVGDYQIMVGTSSRDIAAGEVIRVEKTTGPRYLTTTTKSIVEPGTSVPVTTSFTNQSSYAVQNVSLMLAVPEGWNAHTKNQVLFGSVPSGNSVSVEWVVDIPATVKPGDHQLTGSASYQAPDEGQHSVDAATVSVPYNSLAEAFNNVGITDDANHEPGNFDGVHNSYSAQALAKVGITPGSHLTAGGIEFTWPNVPAGTLDNVMVEGQLIRLSGSGDKLGFLGAGEQGTFVGAQQGTYAGTGTIYYTDGSTQEFALTLPSWDRTILVLTNDRVALIPYLNRNSSTAQNPVSLYTAYVPLKVGKIVQYVKLPNASIHVFDMKLK